MTTTNRQTGRTTRQIQDAPQGAIYVWPVLASIQCAKDIARKLGRDDLQIIAECQFRSENYRGKRGSVVVIDHATRLSGDGIEALRCVRRNAMG